MESLQYLKKKFNIDFNGELPIKLPIDRFSGLTKLFKELGYKVGAEIGVSNGRYSKWISVNNKGVKLYCIDPWKAYPEYVEQHGENSQKILDECFRKSTERLKPFNCELIRKTSMDAVKDFNDNSLDFVFIDGNHSFEYVVEDIAKWEKKVKPGGIVSGHDYWNSIDLKDSQLWVKHPTQIERMKLCQVKDAVDAWMKTNRINPWFLTTDPCWIYVR